MNRRLAPVAVAFSVFSIGTAMLLIAGTQRSALELLDPSLNDISSAFSETDRASQVLSKEGGLSLVGRDYEGNVPRATKEHARSPTSLPAANAATLPDSASRLDHASYVFGSSGGLVFGKGAASSSEFRPNFAHHATISDFHFGDDGGLLFGKRPGQAAMDNSMKKVPKSVKDAIKQAKLWAKKEMGGVKDADAEVVESNRILAKMGVKFGSPSMIH